MQIITNNMILLSRGMNSTGIKVHHASENEFVHLTIHKCRNLDAEEFQIVEGDVNFRICIGENKAALHKKILATSDYRTQKYSNICM